MTPLDLEQQLQHHAASLRGLARDLVRDHHAADDLVQGTLHAALARPPARPGALGGWLATVLRRLHLQRRRSEARRARHEQRVGPAAVQPSAGEHYERRETIVAVTGEVFRLEEPYQTAVLLRYFESLSPSQIARRTNTSVATVKSRLQRALALLRGRLDTRLGPRGQWGAALCAAIALPTSGIPLLTTGTLLMAPTTKLFLGAAATALLVGALVWQRFDAAAPPPTAPSGSTGVVAAATAATTEQARPVDGIERSALPAAESFDNALAHPFAYDLDVRVLDRLGLPVAGAKVLLAPIGCRLDELRERTDADGRLHATWRARRPSMAMVIATPSEEGRDVMRQINVASGATHAVVFGGKETRQTRVRLYRSGGAGAGSEQALAFVLDGSRLDSGALSLEVSGLVLAQGTFDDNPTFGEGMHPFAGFADVQWRARPSSEQGLELTLGTRLSGSFVLDGSTVLLSEKLVATAPSPAARLEGIVYGEDGKPCAKCPVSWGKEVDRPSERTETDDSGAFHFDDVPEGALELRAGGGDAGLRHLTVNTMHGQTATVTVGLERLATVRGRVVDADGKPVSGLRIEWVGSAQPWFDACVVADDGTFVLPNLPGGVGRLLVFRGKQSSGLPVLQSDELLPGGGEVALRFDAAACAGKLQLEPTLPEGVDRGAVEARVFDDATGRGTTLKKVKDSNQFALGGLAAGWYRIEIGGAGAGWVDVGRHFVDGSSVVDLGRIALPPIGTVQLALPANADDHDADGKPQFIIELYERRGECDVRLLDPSTRRGEPLALMAGSYFAMWRAASGEQGIVSFTVIAGREITVTCGPAGGERAPR